MNASAPMFCRPMALIMPAAVSNNARRRIAGHGLARKPLGDEAAEFFERDDLFELDAVAEGAAGGDDRVRQWNTREAHAQVRLGLCTAMRLAGVVAVSLNVWTPCSYPLEP